MIMLRPSLLPSNNREPHPVNFLGHYAGLVTRLSAMILDIFIIAVTFVSLTWFTSVTATILELRSYLGFSVSAIPGSDAFIDALFGPVAGSLLTLLYITGYHVIFWVLIGQTPGKALMGIRVITLDGCRLSPWRALLRYLGYYVGAVPFALGFLWILADDRRQGWHDKIARTCVIYTWAARPDENFLADEIQELNPPATQV
jgi:uncharacterized RDD family membrane protein YckC